MLFPYLFFIFSSFFCVTAAQCITPLKNKISDIIHDNVKKIQLDYVSDIMIGVQCLFSIFYLPLYRLESILLTMSIIQFLRSICLISTVLPPLKTYEEKYRIYGLNGSGTEYIFSGHASYAAITTIHIYEEKLINFLNLFLYNLFSQFLIISTHNHYTIDVILAWIIVPLVHTSNLFK